eukprot:4313751-Amphidinium_carterae.1
MIVLALGIAITVSRRAPCMALNCRLRAGERPSLSEEHDCNHYCYDCSAKTHTVNRNAGDLRNNGETCKVGNDGE